jgi:prolyl oligopeptidase
MNYPKTPKSEVTDRYHGIPVMDDYRWLEDPADPEVRHWTEEQNRLTRAYLDALPRREEYYAKLKALYSATSADYYDLKACAGKLFALKLQPPMQQPFLVMLSDPFDLATEKTILDTNELDPSGSTAIDFYVPSLDGTLVAVSLSKNGSEDGNLCVYETAGGRALADMIPRVNYPTAGGSLAWSADNSAFYYTRYPRPGERPAEDEHFYQQVWFHRLGAPSDEDTYMIGEEFPRIAEIYLESTPDGRYLLALVRNGDGGEIEHFVRDPLGIWRQATRFEDQAQEATLGPDGRLYLLSRQGALRGKILRLPGENPNLSAAETIIPERAAAIEGLIVTENRLYLLELDGGPSQLSVFAADGRELQPVPLMPVSSVAEVVAWQGDQVLYRSASFIDPPAWFHYDPTSGQARHTALFVSSPADFSDCEVLREFAISRDGTRVPINIIRRKGTPLDGQNPVLLTGYGGYGISLKPYFLIRRRIWLDMGGIAVVANLRGGGEYGEAWHRAGNLTNKQNVFDDFVGCARHLIQHKYTQPAKLCIEGGSNGGLLMGAALTQHPELFRAVVSHVGIYDMLRVELDPNGAFNITEFGTIENPQDFEALYEYSPYHRVVDGGAYPAVLLTTGEHDGRVNPAQSRKMAARLQAATSSGKPVLLRTNQAGHGMGTALEERISQDADVFAFLEKQVSEVK